MSKVKQKILKYSTVPDEWKIIAESVDVKIAKSEARRIAAIAKLFRVSCKPEKIKPRSKRNKKGERGKITKIKEQTVDRKRGGEAVTSGERLFCRNFMRAQRRQKRQTAKSISHKGILFCTFCSLRSRAINELTRKLPRMFRDHNSALSNPPRPPPNNSLSSRENLKGIC